MRALMKLPPLVVERWKIVQSDDRELVLADEKTAKKITIEKDTQ
jgi:hypothetical protein